MTLLPEKKLQNARKRQLYISQQKQSNETVIIPETQRYSDFLESPRELMKVAFKYRTVREMTAFD